MRFVKTILILSIGCITLAEETKNNEFDNLAKDINKYMNQFLPQFQSRMFDTTDADAMDLSYIIANATKDILLNSKKPNDDDYVKNIITEMKTTEIPQVDFVTKDPTDEENKKLLAPKATMEDKYTEVIRKKTKKDIDSDAETSYLLQNSENLPSSSVDTPKKEIDSDTETSSFLQLAANQMSSNEDTQRKDDDINTAVFLRDSFEDFGLYNKVSTDSPFSVPLYVMGRDRV